MEIKADEVDNMNKYIKQTAKITGKTSSNIPQAGTYNLDGVQAVTYGRIRSTAGGDYKRTERMREVLNAMLKKLQTKSIGEINNLLNKVLPQIYTNISVKSLLSEITSIMKYKVTDSIGWPYEVKAYTTPTWYGAPVNLEKNVIKLHEELFNQTDYKVSDTLKAISDKIINKTGYR